MSSHAIPQGDPLGPIICMLWTSCGLNAVKNATRDLNSEVITTLFMDDRTLVSQDVSALSQHQAAWTDWSQSVGLIENVAKTAFVAKKNIPVPDQLIPYVTEPVRVLGAFTCIKPRRLCPDELERVNKAKKKPLGSLLQSNFLSISFTNMWPCSPCLRLPVGGLGASLLRRFALNCGLHSVGETIAAKQPIGTSVPCSWEAIPTLIFSASSTCWERSSPLQTGQSKDGMVPTKALCSSCAKRLKISTTSSTLLGSSKAIMIALGLIAPKPPWTNLIGISSTTTCAMAGGPANFKSFSTLGGTKLLIAWPKHLTFGANSTNWISKKLESAFSPTLRLGPWASVPSSPHPGFTSLQDWGCGLLHPHFHHMAWECPSRNTNLAPPSCPFLARFGWSSSNSANWEVSEVRSHLENLVSVLWSLRHPTSFQGGGGEGGGSTDQD